MNHHTTADFWDCYGRLPEAVQRLADAKYDLLRVDLWHPSLHFKRVGQLWSVRVGNHPFKIPYVELLAVLAPGGVVAEETTEIDT